MISYEPWRLPRHAAPPEGGARMPAERDGWPFRSGRPGKIWLPADDGEPPLRSAPLLRRGVLLLAQGSKNRAFVRAPNQ